MNEIVAPKAQPEAKRAYSAAQKASPKPKFDLLTVDDLKKLPDPEWLIEGILPSNGLALLSGNPGSGKSFLALDWACSVASNRKWLGQEVKAGPVVYLCAEGIFGFPSRTRAWEKTHSKLDQSPIRFAHQPLPFSDPTMVKSFAASIWSARIGRPTLIIIDTLARCFGAGDENTARDMQNFVNGVDKLRGMFGGCTALVIHHSTKAEKNSYRGSSALEGATDTMLNLQNPQGSQLTLTCNKQKNGPEFKKIDLKLSEVPLVGQITSCSVVLWDFEKASFKELGCSETAKPDPDAIALGILTTFKDEGLAHKEWMGLCIDDGIPKGSFKNVLNRLSEKEIVVKNDDDRKWYPASPPPSVKD